MACFMAARLLSGAVDADAAPIEARAARAQAARGWFAALALPAAARATFARAVDASATDDRDAMVQALGTIIEATAHLLTPEGRREMEELGERIR